MSSATQAYYSSPQESQQQHQQQHQHHPSMANYHAATNYASPLTRQHQQPYQSVYGHHQQEASMVAAAGLAAPLAAVHHYHNHSSHHHRQELMCASAATPTSAMTTKLDTLTPNESSSSSSSASSSSATSSSLQYNLEQATKSTKGASKLRRDLINTEIAQLRELLPLPASTRQRLSQLQLMALVLVYVRKSNYFCNGKYAGAFEKSVTYLIERRRVSCVRDWPR
jgi:hypothetical protein